MFAGRRAELARGLALLQQAAAGNSRHALITGARGIGKSSFARQLEGLAAGDPRYGSLNVADEDFDPPFVVASHIAQQNEGVEELIHGLLHSIARELGAGVEIKWELAIDLKIIRGTVERGGPSKDATTRFLDTIEDVWARISSSRGGVLLVVDEIDRVARNEGIPTFFKVATEVMAARELDHIMLLAVGSIGVEQLLAEEHPSVDRVFDVLEIHPLHKDEIDELVQSGLHGTGVRIEGGALETMARHSKGMPSLVQLLAAAAYEEDADGVVSEEDIAKVVLNERVQALIAAAEVPNG